MDSQRVDRLKQCRTLHDLLQRCQIQSSGKAGSGEQYYSCSEIDNIPEGIRMMRYFDWRRPKNGDGSGGGPSGARADDGNNKGLEHGELVPCIREEHSLWACRAVATGCGADLAELKGCMKKHGMKNFLRYPAGYTTDKNVPTASSSTPIKATASNSAAVDEVPCVDLQRKLSNCVGIEVRGLQQRVASSTDSKQQQQ